MNIDLRENAIRDILYRMYHDSMKYSNDSMNRWNEPIEPDRTRLIDLRASIRKLLELLNSNQPEQFESYLDYTFNWIIDTGRKYNHIWGYDSYLTSTGTWGVRYSKMRDIKFILEWQCPVKLGDKFKYNTTDNYGVITRINADYFGITWDILPVQDIQAWQICYSWYTAAHNESDYTQHITK